MNTSATDRVLSLCRFLLAAGIALSLPGCAGMSDDMAESALVSPGRYDIYTCPQLVTQATTARAREKELSDLMARSSQGAGGEIANAIAYRTEYLQAKAQVKAIRDTAKEKGCVSDAASNKSVY